MVANLILRILEIVNAQGDLTLSHVRQLEYSQILIRSIYRMSEVSTDLSNAVMDVTRSEKGQHLLFKFLISKNPFQNLCPNMHGNRCCCHVHRLELGVRSSLGVFLLKCALRHTIPNSDCILKLVDWLPEQKRNEENAACDWQGQRPKSRSPAVSLFEAGSTPATSSVSQGWRDRLHQDMSRDAHNRSESIIRSLGEVCRDLEARCDKTEAPLRREKQRVVDLESKLADAETHSLDLQTELETKTTTIRDLDSEKSSLLDQVCDSAQRLKATLDCLEEARAELKQARDDTESRTAILTERSRQQDLTYLAILTGKDEKYDEQGRTLSASKERSNALETELQQSKDHRDTLVQDANANARLIESQQKIIEELEEGAEQEAKIKETLIATNKDLLTTNRELQTKITESLRAKDSEIADLNGRLGIVETTNRELQTKMTESLRAKDSAIADLSGRLDIAETTNRELQTNMTESLRAKDFAIADLSGRLGIAETTNTDLAEQHLRAITDKEMTLNELREERQITTEACQKISEREKTIASQQAELVALRRERDVRLHEFAEAQDLSNRLIAIVGMKRPAPSLSPLSPNRDSSQRRSTPVALAKRDSVTTSHTVKNMKAKRQHNQSTLPSPVQSLYGHRSLGPKEIHRLPLTEVATNALPPKRVTKQTHDLEIEHIEGFDESFNDSDIFTSTEQNKLIEVDREVRGHAWDETTMDS